VLDAAAGGAHALGLHVPPEDDGKGSKAQGQGQGLEKGLPTENPSFPITRVPGVPLVFTAQRPLFAPGQIPLAGGAPTADQHMVRCARGKEQTRGSKGWGAQNGGAHEPLDPWPLAVDSPAVPRQGTAGRKPWVRPRRTWGRPRGPWCPSPLGLEGPCRRSPSLVPFRGPRTPSAPLALPLRPSSRYGTQARGTPRGGGKPGAPGEGVPVKDEAGAQSEAGRPEDARGGEHAGLTTDVPGALGLRREGQPQGQGQRQGQGAGWGGGGASGEGWRRVAQAPRRPAVRFLALGKAKRPLVGGESGESAAAV